MTKSIELKTPVKHLGQGIMMKKYLLFSILSILTFTTIHAQDFDDTNSCQDECVVINENQFYAKIFGGANYLHINKSFFNRINNHTGYVLSGSFGYQLTSTVSLEAEYAARNNHFTRGCRFEKHCFIVKTSSYMGNVLWDLPVTQIIDASKIQPFVGVGLGCDHKKYMGNYFSWQIISGLRCSLFSNTDISLEYRFHQGIPNKSYVKYLNNHSVGVGLAYKFGSR